MKFHSSSICAQALIWSKLDRQRKPAVCHTYGRQHVSNSRLTCSSTTWITITRGSCLYVLASVEHTCSHSKPCSNEVQTCEHETHTCNTSCSTPRSYKITERVSIVVMLKVKCCVAREEETTDGAAGCSLSCDQRKHDFTCH